MKQILYIGNDFTEKSGYNSTHTTLSKLLEIEGFTIINASSIKIKIFRLIDMCLHVVKYRKKVDFILVDTFSTDSFYFAFLTSQLARFFNINYIPILHGGDLPNRLDGSKKLSKMIFGNSYINIAPSNYLKTVFENYGFQVKFIPNPIEIADYEFKERKKFSPNLLWVRSFSSIYNPQMAVKVLKELAQDFPEATMCMIGPEKDETLKNTQELIEKLGLNENITITGVLPKEEWHKLAANFDLFINTTNYDNTPVSVIEAMALGLPVVSTNVGGIPFLVKNFKDGVLVDKNDVLGMTRAILDLMENTNKTIEICRNARDKVELFDWRNVRLKWLNLLK